MFVQCPTCLVCTPVPYLPLLFQGVSASDLPTKSISLISTKDPGTNLFDWKDLTNTLCRKTRKLWSPGEHSGSLDTSKTKLSILIQSLNNLCGPLCMYVCECFTKASVLISMISTYNRKAEAKSYKGSIATS